MFTGDGAGTAPQFETAEYTAPAGTESCFFCQKPVMGTYYRVNGNQACMECVDQVRMGRTDYPGDYARAIMWGIGAAILGMIGYATFAIATGWTIGYLSLGVGWLVARAMLKGSRGHGGRKYQLTAAVLTYAAVSMASIPVMYSMMAKDKPAAQTAQVQAAATDTQGAQTTVEGQSTEQKAPEAKPAKKMGFAAALGMLALIGLASPFLELADPLHGIIGLVILLVGIQIAWKTMGVPELEIDGPFQK